VLAVWVVGGTALGLVEMAIAGSRPEINFSSYSLLHFMLYYWVPAAAGGLLVWAALSLCRKVLRRKPHPVSWGVGLFAAAVLFVYAGLWLNTEIAGSPFTPVGIGANLALVAAAAGVGVAAGRLARKVQSALSRRRAVAVASAVIFAAALLYLAWSWGNIHAAPRAAASPPGADRPNVILITVDALRGDHLSLNGYERRTDPFLSRLAAEGANFSHAFAQATITVRSMSSLFTSLYPQMHGMMKSGLRMPEHIPTLPEVLSRAGYATAGFGGGNPSLFAGAGIVRGYDYYDDCRTIRSLVPQRVMERLGLVERMSFGSARETPPAEVVLDKALSWVRGGAGAPFFLFVHLMDVHAPYLPPEGYDTMFGGPLEGGPTDFELNKKCNRLVLGKSEKFFELVESGRFDRMKELDITEEDISQEELRRLVDLYDGSIAYADSQLERFVGELAADGTLENTVVILTADHGEGFLDHGRLFHSGDLVYDELMHVPLLMRFPKGIPAGVRVDVPVRLIDVMPTVLDIAGIEPDALGAGGPSGGGEPGAGERSEGESAEASEGLGQDETPQWEFDFQGESLVPLVRGEEDAISARLEGDVYCEGALVSCVRTVRWKYIDSRGHNTYELYDLESDPRERVNLYTERPDLARSLAARLKSYDELVRRYCEEHEAPVPISVDEETRKRLRALGYVE